MKPGEVVVSRRLYRSGQSEYLINGRVGRLRDIQEMFMGVGLGPDSYAIIEQGRIGLILSTKPMERRAIIEEAAGVTKFKTKKRLAEAKLESSKVNLSRVNDIVVEVEKQLGSLKRQAAKARRYSEIRDQMRGIVRQMLAGKARELDAEAERVSKQMEELNAAELQRATAIQQQEGEQDRLNRRIYELDAEMRQNQNVLNLTALEVDRSENRIAFNRQRAEELAGRHAEGNAELSQATAQAVEWEARSTSQVQVVTLLREESGALTARVEELAKRAESRATQIAESEAKIEVLHRSSSEAGESLLRLHGEQKQAEEALVHQTEALRKLEANEHDLLETSMRARDDAERAAFDPGLQFCCLLFQCVELTGSGFMVESGPLSIIARAHGSFQQIVLVRFELSQRFGLMHERFFGLLLLAMQAQKTFAGFRGGAAQPFDSRFGFGNLSSARLGTVCKLFHPSGQNARFFTQHCDRMNLRSAPRFPFHSLRSGLRQLRINLRMARRELFGALKVEGNAILAAVHFERRKIQDILVLADLGIQFIDPLIQPVLLAFLLLDG